MLATLMNRKGCFIRNKNVFLLFCVCFKCNNIDNFKYDHLAGGSPKILEWKLGRPAINRE